MGRKPKNSFIEGTIAFKKGTEHKVYDVKLPSSVMVTYKIPISAKLDGSPIYGESTMFVYKPISEKKMIQKEIEKQGMKVIKIEPQIVKLTDLCPQCGRRGIPKIERKDTTDNRTRTWKNKEEKSRTKRSDEFWLSYDHKTFPKKCRIVQAGNYPQPGFKKNERKNIDMRKYYFPWVTKILKNQS